MRVLVALWLSRGLLFQARVHSVYILLDLPSAASGVQIVLLLFSFMSAHDARLPPRVYPHPRARSAKGLSRGATSSPCLITSVVLTSAGRALGALFAWCLAHYLGADLPMLAGRGGLVAQGPQGDGRAGACHVRGAADGARPRRWVLPGRIGGRTRAGPSIFISPAVSRRPGGHLINTRSAR